MKDPGPDFHQIDQQVDEELTQDEFDLTDVKITHVENLFIISYLTKALQDVLIRKVRIFQYPLLLVDLPLAAAILIVNIERFLYVKVLGYVLAHIQYDVEILKDLVGSYSQTDEDSEGWQEKIFNFIRKLLRFLWGVVILLFILPVWPLIWIYNYVIQTILIAIIYYFLMFWSFEFTGGSFVYYLLFMTVTFLVSSITVPFLFKLGVYVKAVFSLEKRPWKVINQEAKLAFLHFYKSMHGADQQSVKQIKTHYSDQYKAEGGVYYMLLKFLHLCKDQLWTLRQKKGKAVVEGIQNKTVEFVDDYYEEKSIYNATLGSLSKQDLKRTSIALLITLLFSLLLVTEGSQGKGLIGPILMSFVDQEISAQIWVNYNGGGLGYYQDMVAYYYFLPNFLSYVALSVDFLLDVFFRAFYVAFPVYLDFIVRYYSYYFGILVLGLWK